MTKTIRLIVNEETTVASLFDKSRYEVLTCEDKDTIVLISKKDNSVKVSTVENSTGIDR